MKETLKKALNGTLDGYRSIPFWSWNNFLDEKELVRQIEEMKSAGIGGFIMHARTGLKEEYLGEKWFSCIEACLKKARELHMEAWVYDENGWPSGFVGGKLLETEAYRARFLEYSVGAYDPSAFASYILTEEGYRRAERPETGVAEYHNVYLRVSPANTDILHPDVVDAFIQETHEKYYARFPDSFGNELAGFFTDEPQYYRWGTPYTPCVEKLFEEAGKDVRDGLIWLFVEDERGYAFREAYFAALNRLYTENFYKKLYDWCEAHGCKLTGHSIEESTLFGQMWGGAAVMPTYEYEHIPAIDWLGRGCGTQLCPKQAGSAASQLGIKRVLTETFACSGYDVTPKELKSIGEYQYFNGVNMMCQHLYPYSLAGRGKTDHPPVFSPQGNWFEEFKTFNDYFARLGYIVANTEENCDVAVLHPMRGVWLHYIRERDYESVKALEDSFGKLLRELRKNGVTFQLVDEKILSRHGGIESGALRVGKRVYDTLIVPDMKTLSSDTYALLKKYEGKLLLSGKIEYIDGERKEVSLSSNVTFDDLKEATAVKYFCGDGNSFLTSRSGDIGDFLFVKNLSSTEQSEIRFQGVAQAYRALDLETLKTENIGEETTLGAGESLVLIRDESAKEAHHMDTCTDITSNFRVTGITKNFLALDCAQMSKGGRPFGEKRPIPALFEELLREDYKGEIFIRQTFTLREKIPLKLIMERADFLSVTLNGQPVSFSKSPFDVNFIEAEIGDKVRAGENELLYSFAFWQHDGVHFALFNPMATESLRNCLYYDTSIEPAYLKGDFAVSADMALATRLSLPPVTSKLYAEGYPFFKGRMMLEGKIDWSGKGRAILAGEGRILVAELFINGERTEWTLDTRRDITDLLKKGENEIKIVLKSSLRNLFGPHHYRPEPEPMGVSPYNFEFRGEWKNGKYPADYTDEYHFVPFGLDRLTLIVREEE